MYNRIKTAVKNHTLVMKEIKKIGFISPTDPNSDQRFWSGTHYRVCEAIKKAGFEVVWIPVRTPWLSKLVFAVLSRIFRIFKYNITDHFIWRAWFESLQ